MAAAEKQREYNRRYRAKVKNTPEYKARRHAQGSKYYKTPGFKQKDQERKYRKKYGISVAERDALLVSQGSACKICLASTAFENGRSGAHLDHCHTTGKIRGVLCARCNLAIGLLGDCPERVQAAAKYLRGA